MSRGRTRTPRRDEPLARRTWAAGLTVLVVLGALGYLATRLYDGVPGRDYGKAYVSAPLVGNLLVHDPVRIGGVRVGQVSDTEVGPDGRPRIELQLEPDVELPADTTAEIRANGLLGARFVDLLPGGSARSLPRGATIRIPEHAYSYGLPEALDVFDEDTRAGMANAIDALGAGLAGRGDGLGTTLERLSGHTRLFDEVSASVLERDGAAARLIPSVAQGMRPLDRNRAATGPFLDALADAAAPFAERRDAVRATLDAAPATLRAAATELRDGSRLLASVRTLSDASDPALRDTPEALGDLGALLRGAPAALDPVPAVLRAAGRAVPGALAITRGLDPLLGRIDDAVTSARPLLEVVGRRGCDIITFGTSMRSMTGFPQTGDGPLGPAMAFRLQAVAPLTGDVVGIEDGRLRRDAYSAPCRYPSTEYGQVVPGAEDGAP